MFQYVGPTSIISHLMSLPAASENLHIRIKSAERRHTLGVREEQFLGLAVSFAGNGVGLFGNAVRVCEEIKIKTSKLN